MLGLYGRVGQVAHVPEGRCGADAVVLAAEFDRADDVLGLLDSVHMRDHDRCARVKSIRNFGLVVPRNPTVSTKERWVSHTAPNGG